MTKITAGLFSLGLRDAIQGTIMAAGGAVLGVITVSIDKGELTFNWTAIWHTALSAAVVYLGKRFFTPAQVIKPATQEQIKNA